MDRKISDRINIYKLYLAIMVVYIHSNNGIDLASGKVIGESNVWLDIFKNIISDGIARCAVPAFFLISAYLLYSKPLDYKHNLKKKVRRLVVPYFILNTFWIAFYAFFQMIPSLSDFFANPDKIVANWDFGDWVNVYLGVTDYPICAQLWFVRDLFVLNVLAYAIKLLIDKFPKLIMVVLLLLLLSGVKSPIFCLATNALCFWSFGCYLAKYKVSLNCVDGIKWRYITPIYVILLVLREVLRGRIDGCVTSVVYSGVIIVGVIFWFKYTAIHRGAKCNRFLKNMSKYSFDIYIFHELNMTIVKKICGKLLPKTVFSQLVQYIGIPILIIGCCIVLCVLMERFAPRMYAILTNKVAFKDKRI